MVNIYMSGKNCCDSLFGRGSNSEETESTQVIFKKNSTGIVKSTELTLTAQAQRSIYASTDDLTPLETVALTKPALSTMTVKSPKVEFDLIIRSINASNANKLKELFTNNTELLSAKIDGQSLISFAFASENPILLSTIFDAEKELPGYSATLLRELTSKVKEYLKPKDKSLNKNIGEERNFLHNFSYFVSKHSFLDEYIQQKMMNFIINSSEKFQTEITQYTQKTSAGGETENAFDPLTLMIMLKQPALILSILNAPTLPSVFSEFAKDALIRLHAIYLEAMPKVLALKAETAAGAGAYAIEHEKDLKNLEIEVGMAVEISSIIAKKFPAVANKVIKNECLGASILKSMNFIQLLLDNDLDILYKADDLSSTIWNHAWNKSKSNKIDDAHKTAYKEILLYSLTSPAVKKTIVKLKADFPFLESELSNIKTIEGEKAIEDIITRNKVKIGDNAEYIRQVYHVLKCIKTLSADSSISAKMDELDIDPFLLCINNEDNLSVATFRTALTTGTNYTSIPTKQGKFGAKLPQIYNDDDSDTGTAMGSVMLDYHEVSLSGGDAAAGAGVGTH